jgi:hypothetical protein
MGCMPPTKLKQRPSIPSARNTPSMAAATSATSTKRQPVGAAVPTDHVLLGIEEADAAVEGRGPLPQPSGPARDDAGTPSFACISGGRRLHFGSPPKAGVKHPDWQTAEEPSWIEFVVRDLRVEVGWRGVWRSLKGIGRTESELRQR